MNKLGLSWFFVICLKVGMVVTNFFSGSNTLNFDNVIGVTLSEESHRKTLGGSTSWSTLNALRRGRMNEKGNNSGNQKERGINPWDQDIVGTMEK